MNEKKSAECFNQALDELLSGKKPDPAMEIDSDLLSLSSTLAQSEFHSTTFLQNRLFHRLEDKSHQVYAQQRRIVHMKQNFAFVIKSTALFGFAAIVVLTLMWVIQNQIRPVQPHELPANVVEETLSATPDPARPVAEEASGFRLEAGDAVPVEGGYILPLALNSVQSDKNIWVTLPDKSTPMHVFGGEALLPFVITDANDKRYDYVIYEHPAEGSQYRYKIEGIDIAWPLTISLPSAFVTYSDLQTEYVLDTGPEPKAGMEWKLDERLTIAGRTVRLLSIIYASDGYYVLVSRSGVSSVDVNIPDAPVLEQGGKYAENDGPWIYPLKFESDPPVGKVRFVFSSPMIKVNGPWEVQIEKPGF